MKLRRFAVVLAASVAITVLGPAMAQDAPPEEPDLVLFWLEGCPHCADEKELLDELVHDFPTS